MNVINQRGKHFKQALAVLLTASASLCLPSAYAQTSNCAGVNVYPDWPSRDWSGGDYNHANSGDKMVYQNTLYQANWYTKTQPGSDASWSNLGACGTSTPTSSVASSIASSVSSSTSSTPSTGQGSLIIAVNAGGARTTYNGNQYQADGYFSGGDTSSTTDNIGGTTEDTVFQSERYGSYSYNIPVTQGTYSIDLQFAEIYHTTAGSRAFNLLIEGQVEMSNVDLYTLAGSDGAYTYEVSNIQVNDGSLDITLQTITDNGTLAGFAVFSENGSLSSVSSSSSSSSHSTGGKFPPFFVGNITTRGNVRSDFAQYWDQITAENEGKWASVEGTRDQYNWSGIDRVYNFAKQNGMPYKQHTFVWGNQSPNWINNLSASEQAAEIEEWIRDYCTRYPDTEMIDVVNEATPGHAPAGYAQNAFGNNWVTRSFELARKYCPNSVLILNDYNVLRWNTEQFIEMARPAINAGVVDAIGLQSHGLETISFSELQRNLDRIASLGLPIYISEYDVAENNDQRQLAIMQEQFPLFYKHPSVKGITIWGYLSGATWVDGTGLINSNGSHRPAMDWLMNYIGR